MSFLQRNWRTFVVAFLGALLAFTGSFLLQPTYASSTELLIRGRDASFLTSTGANLTDQPGVVDSSLSQSLAATYAGLANSRTVAVAVVDRLHLDAPKKAKGGPLGLAARGLVWTYRCGRAYITAGFCARLDTREKAITDVQKGIKAAQHGSNAGATAGMPGSYVLDVVATGDSPKQAQAVTNAVADELVQMSNQRFSDDAAAYVKTLTTQIAAAQATVNAKSAAITAFRTENEVSAADLAQVQSADSFQTLRSNLATAQQNLADEQAQLASTQQSLANTSANQTSTQQIDTGRSSTQLDTTGANPTYTSLVNQRNALQSAVSGTRARLSLLQGQLAGAAPAQLNTVQAQLALLQQALDLANTNVTTLTGQLQKAQSNVASSNTELTRVDTANAPSYPIAPKRYLYLALGMLVGGLAGGALTWLDRRRRGPDDSRPAQPNLDSVANHRVEPELEPVPLESILAGRVSADQAHRNGNGHGPDHEGVQLS